MQSRCQCCVLPAVYGGIRRRQICNMIRMYVPPVNTLLKYMMFKYTTDGRKCQLILHWKRGLKYFFSCLHKIYSQKCMYKPQLPKCWVASILQDLIINLQIVKLKDTGATEIPPLAPELFNREIAFYYLPMTSLNTLRAFL